MNNMHKVMTDKATNDKAKYMKDYYEKNKSKLEEKIKCEICLHEYKKCKKSEHIKTKKHLMKMLEKENKNLKDEGRDEYLNEKKKEIMESTKKILMKEMEKILEKKIKN